MNRFRPAKSIQHIKECEVLDKSMLRELQLLEKEMLSEIAKACEQSDLRYVLVAGTLLGAKRHGGFIPWDDDIDIAMPREDYDRFEKIASTILPEGLYFRTFSSDRSYYLPFGKVCKKGTICISDVDVGGKASKEVYIDVFPLDNAEQEDSCSQKIQASISKGIKAVIIRRKKLKVKKTSIAVRIAQILLAPFSIETLMKWQDYVMKLNKNRDSLYYVNNGSNYPYKSQTMLKEIYFPAAKMLFEGEMFCVPKDTETWLLRIYGEDYMKLPPKEDRVSHNFVELDLGEYETGEYTNDNENINAK